MMIKFIALAFLASACTNGLIYTNTVTPFCTDMTGNNSLTQTSSSSSIKSISIPSIPGARAAWSTNAIGEIAKENGFKTVHYCDRKKFSILRNFFSKDEIIVYGE